MHLYGQAQLTEILSEIKRSSERFRTKPREEYLNSLATHLASKGLSGYQTRKILIEASQTLDHFPSIAELEELMKGHYITSTPAPTNYADCEHCESRGYELWEDDHGHTCIVACRVCSKGKVYVADKKYGCSDREFANQHGYYKKERRV